MRYQVRDPWFQGWLAIMGYEQNKYNDPILEKVDREDPRFVCLYGGERSGKSYTSVAIVGKKLSVNKWPERRNYWIIGPDYMQSRAEFEYLHNIYSSLGLVVKSSMPESPTSRWSMTLSTNERWETRSSADVRKLASFSIHGAMIVEANQQEPAVWLKIRGRLMEKRGWCVLSGTYENTSEWFIDIYYKWLTQNKEGGCSFSLPTWANTKAFPLGEDDPEFLSARESMPAEWYNERYAGVPSKPSNLVIPEFDWATHVPDEPLELMPDVPVELAIDPGKKVYCVIFLQKIGRDRIHVLDCIYKRNWIAQTVIPEVMAHPLWKYVKLASAPHGVIDIAGFAEPGTISQAKIWRDMAGISLVGKKYSEDIEISTLRHVLASNMVYFNNLGNESLNGEALQPLAEFRLWRWRDEVASMSEASSPIDRNNHFTKALVYWILWRIGAVQVGDEKRKLKKRGAHRWGNVIRAERRTGRNPRAGVRETPIQAKRAELGARLRPKVLVASRSRFGRSNRAA